jgi:AhpD family alkylhydroperoxidase
MARVELLTRERAPLLARPYYERGDPGPIAAALANVPELMEVALPFIGTVYGPTSLPPRLKEIVILGVSAASGCRYCTETHTGVARRLGLAPDEVATMRGEAAPPERWEARERALLSFSEAISNRPAEAVDRGDGALHGRAQAREQPGDDLGRQARGPAPAGRACS